MLAAVFALSIENRVHMGAARLVGKPGTGPRRNPTSRPAPPGGSVGAIRAFLGRPRWVCHVTGIATTGEHGADRFRDLLLTNSVILARSVLHDVQVPVRRVGGIGPGSKYGREPAARTSSKRAKYANLGLICRLGHKEVVAVREIKTRHVDGQARRMGAELARRGVIAVAALEPWSGPNRLQLGSETAEDNRDDQIGGPLA